VPASKPILVTDRAAAFRAVERYTSKRVYIRPEDRLLWEASEQQAAAEGISLSAYIAKALRFALNLSTEGE
jgi:hypothetical protein